jgi:hypothetical protein
LYRPQGNLNTITPGQRPALFLQTMLVRQASAGQLRDIGNVIGLPLYPRKRTYGGSVGTANANAQRALGLK